MDSRILKTLRAAFCYGFWGMLAGCIWLLFSWFILSFFEGTDFGETIRKVNAPLIYQVSEKLLYFLSDIGMVGRHDPIIFFLIIFLVYLIVGYLLGFIFYLTYQIFWKIIRKTDG
jgi:hypothetical protein